MDKLTKEEVLHVAHLARIGVSEEEISNYQVSLKQMIDEIDKIKNIKISEKDKILISPNEENDYEENTKEISNNDLLLNVPNKKGNFIKVPVIFNE